MWWVLQEIKWHQVSSALSLFNLGLWDLEKNHLIQAKKTESSHFEQEKKLLDHRFGFVNKPQDEVVKNQKKILVPCLKTKQAVKYQGLYGDHNRQIWNCAQDTSSDSGGIGNLKKGWKCPNQSSAGVCENTEEDSKDLR